MNALSRFIVRVSNAIATETRAAKMAVFRLALAVLLLLIAAALLVTAVGLLLASLFVVLFQALGAAGALACLGGIVLLMALLGLAVAYIIRGR
ncbi:MAG TPA: hypothetical protein VF184_13120 [Phycisphaeraceae bacterium]